MRMKRRIPLVLPDRETSLYYRTKHGIGVIAPSNDNHLRWGAELRLGRTFIGETRPWP
jgi:hypothetical protein